MEAKVISRRTMSIKKNTGHPPSEKALPTSIDPFYGRREKDRKMRKKDKRGYK